MKAAFGLLMASLLAGCAGTAASVRTANQLWHADVFRYELVGDGMPQQARATLDSRLTQRMWRRLSPHARATVTIRVTRYQMRQRAARVLAGVMAGTDRIVSEVTITDAAGNVLGSSEVESTNPTALHGEDWLIQSHADAIAEFVLSGPGGR